MRKITLVCLLLVLITALPAAAAERTRTVTDMMGYEVTLPQEVKTVINLWHANNQVVLLLGGADKLIGTTSVIKELPWYAYVYPRITQVQAYALQSGSGSFNTEEILAAKPDVVITSSPKDAEVLRNAGITAVMVTFRDFEGLKECVRVTAAVLGGDAPARAEAFCAYFDGNLKIVADRLAGLADSERPKVYQVRAENLLQTDGRLSICTEWIQAGGGINVAAEITDENMTEVVLEEVLAVNPDVIIVAMQNVNPVVANPVVENLKTNPAWSSVKAVRDGKLHVNPVGTFLWSRYSCEEALQVLWVAKLLHPAKFADIDMVKVTQDFYKRFYDFDLTAEGAGLMLQGLNPPQ